MSHESGRIGHGSNYGMYGKMRDFFLALMFMKTRL
jgi:hypothetical protein